MGNKQSWFADSVPPRASGLASSPSHANEELQTGVSPGVPVVPEMKKQQSLEETQAAATSLSVRRKAIQDSFEEGGDLMDVKKRALETFAKFGIREWSKDDDSFLKKLIRGYRTKVDEFPDERSRSFSPEKVPEVPTCQCIVMLDDFPESQGVKCDQDHFISQMALNHYIKTENAKEFDEIYQRKGKILCPRVIMGECTSEPYGDVMIARMVDVDVFESYMKQLKRCLYQEAFEEISEKVTMLQSKNNMLETHFMEEQVRLQFKKDDGTYGGFMCPDCKFGPIDHRHCNDLRAHHEQASGNAVISNACPVCGFFTPKLAEWLQWDGTFLRINEEQKEKIRATWKLNREEKAQLDALIQETNGRLQPLAGQWSKMRSQLVSRVNELQSRREFLLVFVARMTTRKHGKMDLSMGKEAYEKHVREFDESISLMQEFIAHLQTQINEIKNSEMWKVGEVNQEIVKAMNEYREAVLGEEDEPARRAKFQEMMDKIKALSTDIDRYARFLKMLPATSALEKIAIARTRSHLRANAIITKLRGMIDTEAGSLVKVANDAYENFLSGWGSESDSEDEPITPEVEETHQVDENGEIVPMGNPLDPNILVPPRMTVQESREKSSVIRENIENYERKYDEIQRIYAEYLIEDGKQEEEEQATILEHFEKNFIAETTAEPDLTQLLEYLGKKEEDNEPRTESRIELLTKMRTELELDILKAHHPEADACESVIVVRRYIGPCKEVNGTYILQTNLMNEKLLYKNDEGCLIQWSTSWAYGFDGKKRQNESEYGAWVVNDTNGRVALALPDNIDNPTLSKGKWTYQNGLGQIVSNQLVEVDFGLVYLQNNESGAKEVAATSA